MATVTNSSGVYEVGETAGLVWHALNEHGPMPLTKLIKLVDAPRDVVLLAVGWLTREDKITIEDGKRGVRVVSLRLD